MMGEITHPTLAVGGMNHSSVSKGATYGWRTAPTAVVALTLLSQCMYISSKDIASIAQLTYPSVKVRSVSEYRTNSKCVYAEADFYFVNRDDLRFPEGYSRNVIDSHEYTPFWVKVSSVGKYLRGLWNQSPSVAYDIARVLDGVESCVPDKGSFDELIEDSTVILTTGHSNRRLVLMSVATMKIYYIGVVG